MAPKRQTRSYSVAQRPDALDSTRAAVGEFRRQWFPVRRISGIVWAVFSELGRLSAEGFQQLSKSSLGRA
jgi:hypothetical protein